MLKEISEYNLLILFVLIALRSMLLYIADYYREPVKEKVRRRKGTFSYLDYLLKVKIISLKDENNPMIKRIVITINFITVTIFIFGFFTVVYNIHFA